jgi:hypothetical protein
MENGTAGIADRERGGGLERSPEHNPFKIATIELLVPPKEQSGIFSGARSPEMKDVH